MEPLEILHRRLHDQRLTGEKLGGAAEVVSWQLAVQAQEFAEAKWSLAERAVGLTDAGVEEAFSRGQILRTHVLRPTWHFVAPEDIGWLLELTAPRVRAAIRYYDRQFGVDDELRSRATRVFERELSGGEPMTRKELAAALAAAGSETEGPQFGHLTMHAELDGLICSGPRRGKQQTYMLLAERAPEPRAISREEALAELCIRYFAGHGPATVRDCSWWSGLTMTDVRAGLELAGDELERFEDSGGKEWYATPAPTRVPQADSAFLVPMYDEIGVAFKDLRMVYGADPPQDGLMARPIVIGGQTFGSWRRRLAARSVTVEATLFAELDSGQRRVLDDAVARFSAFLGMPAELEIELVS